MSGDSEGLSDVRDDGKTASRGVPLHSGLTGYLHPGYPASLAEFGRVVRLSRSEGSLLARPVPHDTALDAMGCYPLFACRDWSALAADLEHLDGRLISLSLVADPFGVSSRDLRALFPD